MTKMETERLTRVEQKQEDMASDITELKVSAKEINTKLDALTSTLDNLSGGKQALIWITGIILTVTGLIIGFFNVKRK
jgi:chaperonin cofactor prefoldin